MTGQKRTGGKKTGKGARVLGWKVNPHQRIDLLKAFPPRHERTVADHVTLRTGASEEAPLPTETTGEIVGRADDDAGVEALVVAIGGTTDRPDGSTYHITWSLGPGRQAKESNDVIARLGWEAISPPVPVILHPARFP